MIVVFRVLGKIYEILMKSYIIVSNHLLSKQLGGVKKGSHGLILFEVLRTFYSPIMSA